MPNHIFSSEDTADGAVTVHALLRELTAAGLSVESVLCKGESVTIRSPESSADLLEVLQQHVGTPPDEEVPPHVDSELKWREWVPTYTVIDVLGLEHTHVAARYHYDGVGVVQFHLHVEASCPGRRAFRAIQITPPIPSAFTDTSDAIGTVSWASDQFRGGYVAADPASQSIFVFVRNNNKERSERALAVTGSYKVKS